MYHYAPPAERAASALAAMAIVAGIGVALILGLTARIPLPTVSPNLTVTFENRPPPSPPPPEPERRVTGSSAPKDAASPRNLRNAASPVLASPRRIPLLPPPIAAATAPASGSAGQSGAADTPGPGQGAGGAGTGTGGGGLGGTRDGIATGPRQIRGRLSVDDFPPGLLAYGQSASAGVRYAVETDGQVSGCRVERSSGYAQVDTLACRLITERFRFRPALDRSGTPIRSTVVETHTWFKRVR